MEVERRYLHNYDDPYLVLAYILIGTYNLAVIHRILRDDQFVSKLIEKEVQEQDFRGPFSDCIIEEILSNKHRVEYKRELNKLAHYYFAHLDLQRLRERLVYVLSVMGLPLE